MSKNEGMNVAIGAIAVGGIAGGLLARGFQNGIERANARRQKQEDAAYDLAVAEALGDAELLGRAARKLVQELAAERAENARLRTLLNQRQAFIDRMRGRSGSA